MRLLSLLVLAAVLPACRESSNSLAPNDPSEASGAARYGEELLASGLENLNRLEEYESAGVGEQMTQRLEMLSRPQSEPSESSVEPLLAAWPEPEMLRQVIERLNQWIRTQRPPADWLPDPMVASLPSPLADLPQVKDLATEEFSRFDAFALREAVWLRDLESWTRGDVLDDLERAKSLFDWTIRNIQIERHSPDRIPQFPWETLLNGKGDVSERAWVFILLARQLGIDAAMLAVDQPDTAANETGGAAESAVSDQANLAGSNPRPWCLGVRIEKDIYLFEPLLGIPIPAPGGLKLDASGRLSIQPATLAQAMADDAILRQLDLDQARPYEIKAADLQRLVVLLEASPTYLARRMKMIESRLSGQRKMVLTTSPTSLALSWKASPGISNVQLWLHPFQTLQRRSTLQTEEIKERIFAMLPFYSLPKAPLLRGRVLHLKGRLIGEEGATRFYQLSRPSNAELAISSAHPTEKFFYLLGKLDATYWSGLIAYERGKFESAIDDFFSRTLNSMPNGPWTAGAQYNLARSLESQGNAEGAIRQYEANVVSPGYHGDLLRAKWLKKLHQESVKK